MKALNPIEHQEYFLWKFKKHRINSKRYTKISNEIEEDLYDFMVLYLNE